MMEPEDVKRYERHMRALPKAMDDPEALAQVLALRAELDAQIAEAVTRLREVDGFSWEDVARGAGISRQACHMKWRKRV